VNRTAIAVGARAPDFTVPDEHGQPWRLSDALKRASQILVFYRGDW